MTRRERGNERRINMDASSPRSRTGFTPGPPLRPRRGLFAGLLVAFGAWVAVLLTLYFTTVYPRHVPGDIRPPEAVGTAAS